MSDVQQIYEELESLLAQAAGADVETGEAVIYNRGYIDALEEVLEIVEAYL